MVDDSDQQLVALGEHFGFVFKTEANKNHSDFTCLFIQHLALTISSQVPVQNKYVHFRVKLFEFQGIVNRMGTAHPRAVRPLRFPGADTLNKHRCVQVFQGSVIIHKFAIKLQAGKNARVLTVIILIGLIRRCPGGHYSHPMFKDLFVSVDRKGGLKIPYKPVHLLDFGFKMNMNFFIFLDFIDKTGQFLRHTVTGSCAVDMTGLPPQLGVFFNDVGFISLARQASGRSHAGDTPADDHGGLIDLEFGFFQRGH